MRIASSTKSPRERTSEKSERKFNVCHASFNTTKVSKNTRGIVSVGTNACLNPMKRSKVPQTRINVMTKSRVREERSVRICSEKSVVVCTTTSEGIAFDSCMDFSINCPLSTRSMMDPHDFFTTERVTAGTGVFPSRERRDSVSRFFGAS